MKMLFAFAILLAVLAVKCQAGTESYIVLLKEGATDKHLADLIQQLEEYSYLSPDEMSIESYSSLLPVLFGNFDEETAQFIAEHKMVDTIEKDNTVSVDTDYNEMGVLEESVDLVDTERYNLDIIDDVTCTDGTYKPFNYGAGADIYVIDSGINYEHEDFGWRDGTSGTRAQFGGIDIIDDQSGSNQRGRDCYGRGTYCSAVAGGLYSGVAKDANLYSIRVLDCHGRGSYSGFIKGLIAVKERHEANKNRTDFVGTIAGLAVTGGLSSSYNRMVDELVQNGIIVVTASGNKRRRACTRSPGSAPDAINVGAHWYTEDNCKKPMYSRSNYGSCVTIMAPGVRVWSADYNNNTGYVLRSSTSLSAYHVAGVAALMKTANSDFTPLEIKERIQENGVDDIDRSQRSYLVRMLSHAKRVLVTPDLIA